VFYLREAALRIRDPLISVFVDPFSLRGAVPKWMIPEFRITIGGSRK